jgi:hypothetical protein
MRQRFRFLVMSMKAGAPIGWWWIGAIGFVIGGSLISWFALGVKAPWIALAITSSVLVLVFAEGAYRTWHKAAEDALQPGPGAAHSLRRSATRFRELCDEAKRVPTLAQTGEGGYETLPRNHFGQEERHSLIVIQGRLRDALQATTALIDRDYPEFYAQATNGPESVPGIPIGDGGNLWDSLARDAMVRTYSFYADAIDKIADRLIARG